MKHSVRYLLLCAGVFAVVVLIGAFAVLECESGAVGATIQTFSDALWWAVNMSSVGDAGIAPVTDSGRMVGAVLCLVGSAVFTINVGIISAVFTHVIKRDGSAS